VTATGNKSLSLGLAFVAGAGVTLMILALGFGVTEGAAANGSAITISFLAGVMLLILGIVGWYVVVQPQKHFDDINVPMYTGHAHDAHHEEAHADEHADEHAIIPHE
jgi:hypothetical protein